MTTSRREFVEQSIAAAGAVMVPMGCEAAGDQPVGVSTGGPAGDAEPGYLELERSGELAEREQALWRLLEECEVCARRCGARRLVGETGVCSTPAQFKVYSAGPHFGEERELVGRGGSGTVFFSNCSLLCSFCQNWEINHRGDGSRTSHAELAAMMLGLQRRGCTNINLVTPSHIVPQIVSGVRIAAAKGLRLPLVYNTGGYDSLEVIELLDGIVDIYLPDFKYQDGELAATYSSGASDYPEVAAAVIREMHRQVGCLETDERGIATRGLIIRHLVMPNNIGGTDRLVRWVADELGPDTYLNLMAQYRPEYRAHEMPPISRRITKREWRRALGWAAEAGLTNVHT
jgi:putative pyruvate formate lyase activating enzyme